VLLREPSGERRINDHLTILLKALTEVKEAGTCLAQDEELKMTIEGEQEN